MALSQLHVVTSLFNPWRYATRKTHYERFRQHVRHTKMCKLYVGELAFGARPFELTSGHNVTVDDGETKEFQFRTKHELWHKERMLNRLVQELPPDWEYCAWIDADVTFVRDDWALETVHMLQHYPVSQLFSHTQNLDSNYNVYELKPPKYGFAYAWANGLKPLDFKRGYSNFPHGHCGFAWGFTRAAYEALGGWLDISILGSSDYLMAMSMTGQLPNDMPKGITSGYRNAIQQWEARATQYIKKNVGYVDGLINHYWHGNFVNRQYDIRGETLVNHQFDPNMDLKMDPQGLYAWTDRCPQLQYDVRRYFATRLEDHPS